MAGTEFDERNIIEGDPVNWRLIVYPILAGLVMLLAGFGIYYYQLNQREQAEEQAAAALGDAKTADDMAKVADQYPRTVQAGVALMRAADLFYSQDNFDAALKDYQRVTGLKQAPTELRDSAQLGVAATQEADGQGDAAIQSYLTVAHKGSRSPFSPVAYHQAAQIFADRKDKASEAQLLQQAVQLGGDSPFVKDAADQLKALAPAPVSPTPAAGTNAAPVP
jgi:predicted negative regulator of RcsB-dependent stress response